jgi:hypothetical protein
VPGFIGFAVGRTTFWDPLVAWRSKKATREQAVALTPAEAPLIEAEKLFGQPAPALTSASFSLG